MKSIWLKGNSIIITTWLHSQISLKTVDSKRYKPQDTMDSGSILFELRHWFRVSYKELVAGALNGLAVALTTAGAVVVWSRSPGLALVTGASMVISLTAAGLAGAAIPMVLTSLHQDPAQALLHGEHFRYFTQFFCHGGDPLSFEAARIYIGEIVQVGRYIERKSVHGHMPA